MLLRVRQFAARHALWSPDTRVVAAVSGGGDSVALLVLLRELARAGELELAGAVHVHHHIRGAAADADAQFCRDLANRLGVHLTVAHRDVPALAVAMGQSLEVAGREARRAALLAAAGELGAFCIATAHTRDDQAETVLLRMTRGTGISGLAGILPRRDRVIRPLLDLSRQELRDWLEEGGYAWQEDATNGDLANPRNRLRAEVLPYLSSHFNPAVADALVRLAEIAREEDHVVHAAAAEAAQRVISMRSGAVVLDREVLATVHRALARRVVREAFETVRPGRAYDLEDVDLVCEAASASGNGPFELRGIRVERNRAEVVLVNRALPAPQTGPFRYDLSIPGAVTVAEAGCVVEADGPMPPEEVGVGVAAAEAATAAVAGVSGASLIVRSRLPGDRLRLPGGRTKLQDLFVNRKVGRLDRDRTPIVTDAEGRIVWVCGLAVAEEFRVSDRTNAVVILKLRRL